MRELFPPHFFRFQIGCRDCDAPCLNDDVAARIWSARGTRQARLLVTDARLDVGWVGLGWMTRWHDGRVADGMTPATTEEEEGGGRARDAGVLPVSCRALH
jgi:hypothetical protein